MTLTISRTRRRSSQQPLGRSAVTRRILLGGILAPLALGAGAARAQPARPRVFIFLHTDVKSAALEKTLATKMPNLVPTVFGRFKDFEDAVAAQRPDAVVAVAPFLSAQKMSPTLQGTRAGKDWEAYVLLTVGAAAQGPLAGKTVGAVDFLGRTGTQEFVAELLKAPDVKLKRVTKLEDLLPLLQFAAADAVLVPGAATKIFTERSRMPLKVRELPDARVGLPAIAVLNSGVKDLVSKSFLALDGETNRTLGVERWVLK